MSNFLVPANFVQYRLTLKLRRGVQGEDIVKYRYFTEKEAQDISAKINSPAQFLVFGSEFFPKFGAVLEKLQESEIKQRYQHYFNSGETERRLQSEQKAKEARQKIETWITEHPAEYAQAKTEAIKKFGQQAVFLNLTQTTQKALIKAYARNLIAKKINS